MNKLDDESWDDYAFRNNLYKIKYSYKDVNIIDDIIIPNHTKVTRRHYDSIWYINNIDINIGTRPSFLEFIMYELYNLKKKYNLGCYYDNDIIRRSENNTEQREKDSKRQNWLLKELAFLEKIYDEDEKKEKEKEKEKEKKREDNKKRFFELKTNISETHKEQLDEFLTIIRVTSIQYLEGDTKYKVDWKDFCKETEKKVETQKKERIELYQKYVKNKVIQAQITELEQKINQLKCEIVK